MEIRKEISADGHTFLVMDRPIEDRTCLNCDADIDDRDIPYFEPCHGASGIEFRRCLDHASAAWQDEVIEFERGIEEEDRFLPEFLLD